MSTNCKTCGAPLMQRPGQGRPKDYCSVTCRRQAEMEKRRSPSAAERRVLEKHAAKLLDRITDLKLQELGDFADCKALATGLTAKQERLALEAQLDEINRQLEDNP